MLRAKVRALVLGIATVLVAGHGTAQAAPPSSCVSKFVGAWSVRVDATGQTYTSQIRADGTLSSACFMCAPVQSWTCNGNTFVLLGPGSATHTLSADGRHMSGSCCTLTRLGAPPAAPAVAASKPTQATPPTQSPALKQQPLTGSPSKKASCSDITGTGSTTPAANDCKDANRSLHAARVTREKYPVLSQYEYKKAAAAAQRAGDTQLELTILREATAPPPTKPSAYIERCNQLMQEAQPDITAAEAIEKEDPSCAGLTAAAEHYYTVGKLFFRAIELGQAENQLLSSCPYLKTNEFLLRRDRLLYRVDDMKAQKLCDRRSPDLVNKPGGSGDDPPNDEDERRKGCEIALKQIAPHAPSKEWLADNMARAHCRPDGVPMSRSEIAQWESTKKKDN